MKFSFLLFLSVLIAAFIWWLPSKPSAALLQQKEKALKKYGLDHTFGRYCILIDYSKPVFRKRLWVVDQETNNTVIHSHVSHAKKSGQLYAKNFSNEEGSEISCKGIFKTLHSYESSFGKGIYKIGMRVEGLETGMNDHANKRNIVFHTGKSWWSKGCFMTWPRVNKKLIELCKDGSLVLVN